MPFPLLWTFPLVEGNYTIAVYSSPNLILFWVAAWRNCCAAAGFVVALRTLWGRSADAPARPGTMTSIIFVGSRGRL